MHAHGWRRRWRQWRQWRRPHCGAVVSVASVRTDRPTYSAGAGDRLSCAGERPWPRCTMHDAPIQQAEKKQNKRASCAASNRKHSKFRTGQNAENKNAFLLFVCISRNAFIHRDRLCCKRICVILHLLLARSNGNFVGRFLATQTHFATLGTFSSLSLVARRAFSRPLARSFSHQHKHTINYSMRIYLRLYNCFWSVDSGWCCCIRDHGVPVPHAPPPPPSASFSCLHNCAVDGQLRCSN